jgi:thymidylate synthase
MSFEKLKNKVDSFINRNGIVSIIKNQKVSEVLNYRYRYDSTLKINVTDDEIKYVIDKLNTYEESLKNAINYLKNDIYNRQSLVQFDQSQPFPNCTVSIQFQIRKNTLYTTVFQRSQDIDKMAMDCEIFNRMSLYIIKNFENVDSYKVIVFVSNMHKILKN